MIVPDSFKSAYIIAVKLWSPVEQEANYLLRQICSEIPGASFKSRIKDLESSFMKAQKGEYENPLLEMEDFYAATLILPFKTVVPTALEKIDYRFGIIPSITEGIRPSKKIEPYDFSYNDLHLWLRLKDSSDRPDKSIISFKFELQIKTLLQAAWQQASHDIVYKPSRISWGVERIAFRLRALLELADDLLCRIEEAASLSRHEEDMSYKVILKNIIEVMERHFGHSDLPTDRRRMASIVNNYLQLAGIDLTELDKLIIAARERGIPFMDVLTLTPMEKVFLLIYDVYEPRINKKLLKWKSRVLITEEMEDFYPRARNLTAKGRVQMKPANAQPP